MQQNSLERRTSLETTLDDARPFVDDSQVRTREDMDGGLDQGLETLSLSEDVVEDSIV